MIVSFNINDAVKFKLTGRGKKILEEYLLSLKLQPTNYYQPDENGEIKMHLWEVMHIFGSHIHMGCLLIFDTNQFTFTGNS